MEFEDEENNQFLQDLQQYPNYFQMGTEKCSSSFWRKIAKKIEDEKEELLKSSDLDRIKNQNLEACASYYLGNVDKAEQIITKVLEETNSTNINACAMMAILKYRKEEIIQAKRYLSRIKELAANPYNIDVAKSELAYAYSRLNPIFYKKAISLYTDTVDRNPNIIPWKYGLASIYRRCLRTDIQSMFPDLQIKTCFNEAKKYLKNILENCSNEKDRFFKASSYIELAELYCEANTTRLIYTDKRKIIDLVNQGVQSLPNNTTILMKAGKILRHCFKFAEAEELLQKAYDICPNTYICHQLGLIQKNTIIYQHKKSTVNVMKSSTPPPVSSWQISKNKKNKYKKKGWKNKPVFKVKESSPSQTLPVSKMSEDVSSGPTSTITNSGLRNKHVFNMKRLINSPKKETFDLELSRKLDPCLDLFRQSAELGQERNLAVYYVWGITLLQMIPTKFEEVMEKFNHILAKECSPFKRYICYEQYGICYIRMSESQDLDEKSREDHRQNATEMFRKAIRCRAHCQKLNLSKHFDDAEGTEPKGDMESLNHLVSLYPEVYDKLQHTSDTDTKVIKGIIRNHLHLKQYTGILDLLAILLCSKEGLQCLEFKTEVLKQIMHYSIDTNDYELSESVFEFEKDLNVDNDVAIIFNEEDQVSKKKGATLKEWLQAFSNSGLKLMKSTKMTANLPQNQEQIKSICNSKMAIFILDNETPSTELTYLMNNDILKTFRSMKITHQPNTLEEQDKSEFLKTFSNIFFAKTT